MKKRFRLLFLLFILAVVQFSCTSILVVKTVEPAAVKVAADQWKVAAINRFNPDLLSLEDEKEKEVYKSGAREAFFGAVDAIIEDSTFSLVFSDSAAFPVRSTGQPLSKDQLQEIYKKKPFHLILSLEAFDVEMKKENDRIVYENGAISNILYFTLVTTSSWILQDSLGNVLDQVKLSEEDLYQSTSLVVGMLAGVPEIKNAGDRIKDLAWFTGYDYWKRLWPQPLNYTRPYYSAGKLSDAAQKMAAEDWEGAIALLEPMSLGRSRNAAKASYNLAVIYEAMGKIEWAKYWASEAIRKNDRMAKSLLMVLERK